MAVTVGPGAVGGFAAKSSVQQRRMVGWQLGLCARVKLQLSPTSCHESVSNEHRGIKMVH